MKVSGIIVLVVAALSCTGCGGAGGPNAYHGYDLGPANDAVAKSIEWMGGYEKVKDVSILQTTALVTEYNADSRTFASRQQYKVNFSRDYIYARTPTGEGYWNAWVWNSRKGWVFAHGFDMDAAAKQKIKRTLAMIFYCIRGPMNFLGHEQAVSSTAVRQSGMDLVRVGVKGSGSGAEAYYFDRTTGQLRFVTFGADCPGAAGTVAIYRYQKLPDGLMVPVRIELMEIGQNVLIGQKRVLDVEFSDITVRTGWTFP